MPLAEVITLYDQNMTDVSGGLRRLADRIDAGDFDDAHNLVWVIDKGDGRVAVGLFGAAGEAGPVAYLLLALGQRAIESLESAE